MAPYPPARSAASSSGGLGLLLAVPAVLLALLTLVVPSGQTIWGSFRKGGGILTSHGSAGSRNYELLGHAVFWKALGFSLVLVIVPLIVGLVVGPLLAAALEVAGTWPRRVGRVLLSLPLVVFSPVAIAGAWWKAQAGRHGIGMVFGRIGASGASSVTVALILAAGVFGAVCGIALLVFLPVLRGRTEGRPLTPTMVTVGALTVLTGVALGLQAFAFTMTLTGGASRTPATLQDREGLMILNFGGGMAIATVTGLLLGVLGLAATFIAIRTAFRIELSRAPGRRADGQGTVIGVLALVVVMVVIVFCSWPWLSSLFASGHHTTPVTARNYLNTWVPPVLSALISVGSAFLAALGIGGLRPLGRRSEWLLMGFAPWLFVGVGPLSLAGFENARSLHLLNHFVVLISPILVSVPCLVILTFFCRPRAEHWQADVAAGAPSAPAFFRRVVTPALPLAGLLAGAVVLLGAQGLLWPRLVGTGPRNWTAPVVLFAQQGQYGVGDISTGAATPIVAVLLALIALGALQIFYLDRLVITTGATETRVAASAPWAPPQQATPYGPGQLPGGQVPGYAPYPTAPGQHPAGPAPYPGAPGQQPPGPAPYPGAPGQHLPGPAPYRDRPGQHPPGPAPYPGAPGPYPGAAGTHPGEPGPYPAAPGQQPYAGGHGVPPQPGYGPPSPPPQQDPARPAPSAEPDGGPADTV